MILTVGTTDTNAATLSKPITAEATDSSTTAPPTPTPTSWLPTTNGSNAKTKPNASLTPALLAKTMTAWLLPPTPSWLLMLPMDTSWKRRRILLLGGKRRYALSARSIRLMEVVRSILLSTTLKLLVCRTAQMLLFLRPLQLHQFHTLLVAQDWKWSLLTLIFSREMSLKWPTACIIVKWRNLENAERHIHQHDFLYPVMRKLWLRTT